MNVVEQLKEKFALDHIGLAVNSLEEGFEFYKSLGISPMTIEDVPSEKVRVGMLEMWNDCRIELLESTDQEGPISKFLQKKGPGIHHICFRVKNLRDLALQLKNKKIRLINEEPRPGAHGTEVVFIHPKSANGVLVELSEKIGQN